MFIQSELLKLFSESEAGGAEFFRFLAENKITVLSRGNNKLYKVEPHLGGESYVLKLEKRLAGPELPEEILKLGALKDSILPYGAKRQCVIPGQSATFNIVTTPFFTGKDLLSRIVDDRSNDLKRLRDAAAIYEQMAGILLSIQAEHFIFPDMKNSNWLISEDNRLHISDTKSFLSADRDHNTVQIDQVFRITNTKFIHTREFLPPEFDQVFVRKQKPISIDKMHAHLLGLNLYQCMTICDDADVAKLKRNMNNPILNSSNTSRRLKYLIEHLLIEDPTERMSLAEAQKFLHRLAVFPEEAFLNKNEICEQLLADLEKNYQYANYDPHIHQFGMDMQKRLREAFLQGNMDELENIHQKLRDTINQQQKAFEIKNIIAEFKAKAGFFTIGMRKKAQNIENAMALVPLDKRADIMKADCAEGYEVKRALSQHRLFTLFRAKPQEGEMGHEEKAAKSYKRAKNAMSR